MTLARRAVLALLAAPALRPAAARAQGERAPGSAEAVLFQPMPAGARFAIDLLDDGPSSRAIKLVVEKALAARGLPLGTPARFTLSFETGLSTAAGTSRLPLPAPLDPNPNLGRGGRPGEFNGPVDPRAPARGRGGAGLTVHNMTMVVQDNQTGRRAWQGKGRYVGSTAGDDATFQALARRLAAQVGRTVRGERFEIE